MSKTLKFKVFCIENFKIVYNISGAETVKIFQKYDVLEYIEKSYDFLHTTGHRYIVQDLSEYIENRKFKE